MEALYLDIRSRTRVVDFLSHWSGFAPKAMKARAEAAVHAYDEGQELEVNEMSALAKELAREIWPVRYALDRFFGAEGALIEWDKVERTVSKSTAHLMERFRKASEVKSLDELLAHDDFDMTFGGGERDEIESVRHQVREDYLKTNANSLERLVEDGVVLLEEFEHRMKDMRRVAEGLPMAMQEELYGKVTQFEDKWFFKGEQIASEILDEELSYYRDQSSEPVEDVKEGENLESDK